MSGPKLPEIEERRRVERAPMPDDVTVRLVAQVLSGPGQNASDEGVCFVCDDPIRVEVILPDGSTRVAEVVRAQSLGDGKTGLALKFV